MTLTQITHYGINPALTFLAQFNPAFDSKAARHNLLAIGLQESRFQYRRQIGFGPAMGFWQFERGGGVAGVMHHPATKGYAELLCKQSQVAFTRADIWKAIEHDDVLAAGIARLLLWSDPFPLPERDEKDYAWEYYFRNWRPGKPHPQTWDDFYQQAGDFVYSTPAQNASSRL